TAGFGEGAVTTGGSRHRTLTFAQDVRRRQASLWHVPATADPVALLRTPGRDDRSRKAELGRGPCALGDPLVEVDVRGPRSTVSVGAALGHDAAEVDPVSLGI